MSGATGCYDVNTNVPGTLRKNMLMKLGIIHFKGSLLAIISYRHYEKMRKRNRFVNCQKYLHSKNQNDVVVHFQKLKNTCF